MFIKRLWLYFFIASFAFSGCTPKAPGSPTSEALSTVANQIIVPWHQQFEQSTLALYEQLERFCQNPGNKGELTAARDAWKQAMLAWEHVEIINFGPIQQGNLGWKIQFWPDSHNRIGRKMVELLAKDSPITKESLANSVVLVQGLSAIEFVLFDPQYATEQNFNNPKTCDYLQAASSNTHDVAKELLQAWQSDGGNFIGSFLSAGPNNKNFASEGDAVGAVLSSVITALENLKNKKIGEPFGGEPGAKKFNPYKLELWRSQFSLPIMQSDARAIQRLVETSIAPLLSAKGQNETAKQLTEKLEQLNALLQTPQAPLFETLRQPENLNHWQLIWQNLAETLSILKRDVPSQLEVQMGFNSNDGD